MSVVGFGCNFKKSGPDGCQAKAHFANRINKAYQAHQKAEPEPPSRQIKCPQISRRRRKMRLSVLIDKLAQIAADREAPIFDPQTPPMQSPTREYFQTKRTQNTNEVISPKSLCQPISRVVRGLSRPETQFQALPLSNPPSNPIPIFHQTELQIQGPGPSPLFSVAHTAADSWATLMPPGSRPAQISKNVELPVWFLNFVSILFEKVYK